SDEIQLPQTTYGSAQLSSLVHTGCIGSEDAGLQSELFQPRTKGWALCYRCLMLVGTGIDLIEVPRIAGSIERFGERFLRRIFTDGEIAYCRARAAAAESFAARFAAKEAGAKALGTGIQHGVSWKELEVQRLPGQRPVLHLTGRARAIAGQLGVTRVSLSLTHTAALAMATVHLEG
ncbi:MAG: holo-ACP synthase, partial [Acidobacteriaceae bacterium]